MKVRENAPTPALRGRTATVIAAVLVSSLLALPVPAHAITRDEVIARALSWTQRRVPYSRRAYFGGYRRDCSGMVSMAWSLGKSLTSRSISSRAWRIPVSALQPGDAVLTPGHVAVFGGWKNRGKGTFIALEEGHRGAVRAVRRIARNAKGLRYRGITEPVLATAAPAPVTATTTVAVTAVLP